MTAGPEIPFALCYRIAVEEARFQARLNWLRARCLLLLNVTMAALALLAPTRWIAVLALSTGVAMAALSMAVLWIQRGYLRAARDRLRRLEQGHGLS